LDNVTLEIDGATATTDGTGRFLLSGIAPGHHEMLIDGRTASRPGRTYGVYEVGINIEAGKTTALSYTIWMPKLDMSHAVTIQSPTTAEVAVTTPRIPGLEVRIPAHTVIRDHEGLPVTQVSITPVPLDRPPFPLPQGVEVPIYFTTQPGGAYVHAYNPDGPKGARLIYPNSGANARPPGTQFDFWHYDPKERGWFVYGHGKVTESGEQVVPDPGVEVYEFTGAMVGSPGLAPDKGPKDCGEDGDPVNLGTGLFVMDKTDLILPDVLPIVLSRTYRQLDTRSRAFGIGASHSFDLFLVGTTFPYTFIDIVLPDGGRIHYDRISPGTSYADAVYENTTGPAEFFKSRITWNGAGYAVALKDGSTLTFKDGFQASRPGQAGLLKIKDRYGNTITITRDGNGNVTRVVSPNARWIEFTNDGSNRITQARDNLGRTVNYTYDAGGRLWRVTDAAGGITEYTYDSSDRMLTIKDARGIVFLTNEYDSSGRVKKQTQADSTTYQLAYTVDGNDNITQTDVTDPRGNVRTVTFNSDGYTVSDTRGCCGGVAYTVERQPGTNLVLSVTDPLGRRTEYSYDGLGNGTSVTRLAGTAEAVTTSFTYEPTFNQVASATDPLFHTTQFGYDGVGNLISVTDPLNHQTTIAYNSAGQAVSVTDPLFHTTQFGYEGGDLISVTNPLGQSITRFIDGGGRMLSMTNPLGQRGRIEYDLLNQPTRIIDPLGGATSLAYDPNGNLLSVTDARNSVTGYGYDNMDRVVTRTDPLQRQDSYQYDENGNLKQATDRKNQVTGYEYDSLDRLTRITYADFSTTSYTYDEVNRLMQVVDSNSGSISYTYDNLDRLTSETTPQGTVSYTYDAAGRRSSMTVSGQPTVSYTYDDADQLTQITQGSSTVAIAYDTAGRRTTLTLPNGVVTEYGYDSVSRLTSLTYRHGTTTLGSLTYEYNTAGRVTRIGGSFARTLLPQPMGSASYNAANQQTTFGGQVLTYDANGNLTSDGISGYGWNSRDQLVSTSGSGLNATFNYDALGRRVSKSVNGLTTDYVYDGVGVVQEQVGGSANANMLLGGIDEVFTRTGLAGTLNPIADGLGSVFGLTDSAGLIQTHYSYEPFGKTVSSGTPSGNTSQYTGRENDGTGIQYNRARYYSPTHQRFLSEDPIGFAGGNVSLYAYAMNDPINFADVSGLQEKSIGQSLNGRNVPGALDYTGASFLWDGINRAWYEQSASMINSGNPLAGLERVNLQDRTFNRSSSFGKAATEYARETRSYTRSPLNLNRAAGSASRTSGAVNRLGRMSRVGGGIALAIGVGSAIYNLGTAGRKDRGSVASEEIGGLLGGLGGGYILAYAFGGIGFAFGGPLGGMIGAFVGGAVGGAIGYDVGRAVGRDDYCGSR
jgi:RHS repeat-associated protein